MVIKLTGGEVEIRFEPVHGAGAAPRQAMVLSAVKGVAAFLRSCCRVAIPAAISLPADNTWACRGAPPAPWNRSARASKDHHMDTTASWDCRPRPTAPDPVASRGNCQMLAKV